MQNAQAPRARTYPRARGPAPAPPGSPRVLPPPPCTPLSPSEPSGPRGQLPLPEAEWGGGGGRHLEPDFPAIPGSVCAPSRAASCYFQSGARLPGLRTRRLRAAQGAGGGAGRGPRLRGCEAPATPSGSRSRRSPLAPRPPRRARPGEVVTSAAASPAAHTPPGTVATFSPTPALPAPFLPPCTRLAVSSQRHGGRGEAAGPPLPMEWSWRPGRLGEMTQTRLLRARSALPDPPLGPPRAARAGRAPLRSGGEG